MFIFAFLLDMSRPITFQYFLQVLIDIVSDVEVLEKAFSRGDFEEASLLTRKDGGIIDRKDAVRKIS